MKIGKMEFDTLNHTYVMGILNVTPDSFSDGGLYNSREKAVRRVARMVSEGADIVDVGGESTKPDCIPIDTQEEIERVVPIIEAIKEEFDIPISIDTYKSEVAKAAIGAGADMVNDIWGLKYDEKMAPLIAESETACCLMHNRNNSDYIDFKKEMFIDMKETISIAQNAGIQEDKIILDPGIGFGKTYDMNIEVLRYLEDFHLLGFPMLLAASRKSVIGITLNLPVEDRLEGTLVTTMFAVLQHYGFVRVHDVRENKRVIRMAEGILQGTSIFY